MFPFLAVQSTAKHTKLVTFHIELVYKIGLLLPSLTEAWYLQLLIISIAEH